MDKTQTTLTSYSVECYHDMPPDMRERLDDLMSKKSIWPTKLGRDAIQREIEDIVKRFKDMQRVKKRIKADG